MEKEKNISGISVLMPSYNQAAYISRAIKSLQLQTFSDWELLIIDDGSTDYTKQVIEMYLPDARIRYFNNPHNQGLGYCLNKGLQNAIYDLVAYLPSDDIYYKDHLQSLVDMLTADESSVLAYSGMLLSEFTCHLVPEFKEVTTVNGYLQLVQVLHKKSVNRWLEREELVTDDLGVMYWNSLQGNTVCTGKVTCEWVCHPYQRHKIINETLGGGIGFYKKYYQVTQRIRFQSRSGNLIDEPAFYAPFGPVPKAPEKLRILLVGELAYNAERIYALEEYGHKLYGLWIDRPLFYNAIGPLPFGNIEDIPLHNWHSTVQKLKPDIIYGLLNFQAIPLAHQVLMSNTGIPFIWHFKEGPFIARQYGLWKELIDLYVYSDGQIFINQALKDWYSQYIPLSTPGMLLDGDLPKKNWFTGDVKKAISSSDGEIHTVVPGRPSGIDPKQLSVLKNNRIHLHFYGDLLASSWKEWAELAKKEAGPFIHFHPHCNADQWTSELSQYDAGWLHIFDSHNHGEIMRANWNDLNYPCRISTLAAAGLPMIQKDNEGHIVASQELVKEMDIGVFFKSFDKLGDSFSDKQELTRLKRNVWERRMSFAFDEHVETLSNFFQTVIENYKKKKVNLHKLDDFSY